MTGYCRYTGVACEFATEFGYCQLTGCVKWHERTVTTMNDDTISRQAVLKLLYALPPEEATTKAMLIQNVKQMDAKQPEQRLIPWRERLPEDKQPILFSTIFGRVHQGRFHRDNSLNPWYSSLDKKRSYKSVVNAWMPLPEPYKEKS
jgi:hypothetical protein